MPKNVDWSSVWSQAQYRWDEKMPHESIPFSISSGGKLNWEQYGFNWGTITARVPMPDVTKTDKVLEVKIDELLVVISEDKNSLEWKTVTHWAASNDFSVKEGGFLRDEISFDFTYDYSKSDEENGRTMADELIETLDNVLEGLQQDIMDLAHELANL